MAASISISRQMFIKGMAAMAAGGPRGGQLASVTIDLSRASGKTVQPYLYGYASGALLDDDFRLAANGAVERSAGTLSPALLRFNTPVSSIMRSVFAKGASDPDWTPFARWVQHRGDFLAKHGRLVFGIGPAGGDTSISPATWGEYARATALHFRQLGQEITYWEAGNECDPMGAVAYSRYFNAIADALHSVNPAYRVGGPVASWWNGIDLPTFVRHSGSRIGFIDFHSYPVDRTDSTLTAFKKAVTFADVANARHAIAGTAAARLPIGLLEYNLNGDQQPDGAFGLPAQGTIKGAVYVALLLTQAFESDAGFAMAGLWDLAADSNYGAIGNAQNGSLDRTIDEQGWYLRQAARLMPGQQVHGTTTAGDLQVLATRTDRRFAVQVVNYNLDRRRSVKVSVKGRAPKSQVTSWELSARHPSGHASATSSLVRLSLPPQSVVILTGERSRLLSDCQGSSC